MGKFISSSSGGFPSLLLLIGFLFSSTLLIGQHSQRVDSLYNYGVTLYQKNQIEEAKAAFESVIRYDNRHKDAIYNLAMIEVGLGNKDSAIALLQTGVKLKDREAARFLKEELGQKINYSDTMLCADVDVLPRMINKTASEEAVGHNGNISKAIEESIIDGVRHSKVLKGVVPGKRFYFDVYFGMNGEMNAVMMGAKKDELIEKEFASIVNKILIVPAQHLGKEVVCGGFVLPLNSH